MKNQSLTQNTSYSSFVHSTNDSPENARESERRRSSVGSRGKPLVTAKCATSLAWRDEERFGERKGTHRTVVLQETS